MSRIGDKKDPISIRDLMTYMSILILICPWGALIEQFEVAIEGFFWIIVLRPTNSYIDVFSPLNIVVLIFVLPRVLFAYMLVRLYQDRTRVKRVVSIGVIVEFEIVFWAILGGSNVLIYAAWPYVMIGVPLPILLLSALYILKHYPPEHHDDTWLYTSPSSESVSSPNPNQQA